MITGVVALVRGQRTATMIQFAWMVPLAGLGAFAVMEVALFRRDYTVSFVQQVGSETTPPIYNFAALWSALEGSLILWALVLGLYIAAVLRKFSDRRRDPLFGWAVVVLLGISSFFFGLMTLPANPFQRVAVAADFVGRGPNPLLQDHVLVAFHPPMLYLGYVGFSVPFAFAVAALITGRLGEGWLVETRRWTVIAWGFLTFGIVLGAWWSYEVLGWGGYWAWDPVENASLLPWLTGTAYLHSVMVQERRGMLRVWNLSLVCATFALTILGTFLTRSGVIDSVHAFADGEVGPWLLTFFAVITLGSVGLIGWRGDRLRSPGAIDSPLSREAGFLANNVLFGAMAFVVLLGTVFPLLAEAIDGSRLTIGRPYFDSLGRPIAIVTLFLMAVAPVLPWRKASTELLSTRLFWPAVGAVGVTAFAVLVGARGFWPVITFALAGFAGGSALRHIVLSVRRQGVGGLIGRSNGGMVVHLGVIILAMGVAASESYKTDRIFTMEPGDTVFVEEHSFTYEGLAADRTSRRDRTYARVAIDGGQVYEPARTRYTQQGIVVGTPSVRPGFTEDLYLVLDDVPPVPDGPIRLRVIVRPLITWIWAGGILMGLGTLLAVIPGSRRKTRGQSAHEVGAGEGTPTKVRVSAFSRLRGLNP
ncbi:MAG: heme lyase CcmF/NrfE family subunit [Acidimicrobiales bacterium]|nr:heme lyase CcmF/NrfE family subunit [Acidimicrobiales bacterium]